MSVEQNKILLHNISELVTNEKLVAKWIERRNTSASHRKFEPFVNKDDLSIVKDAWLALKNGKILSYGNGEVPYQILNDSNLKKIDTQKSLVMPGLIDSHTHPLWAGSRHNEFVMRLNGATYQQIADNGGGITSTVKATRLASDEQLEKLLEERLERFLQWGVTSAEIKSGYGLSTAEELRHLRIIDKVKNKSLQTLKRTCLALHSIPPEFHSAEKYANQLADELLPKIKEEALADYLDVFIEKGYFQENDCRKYFKKGQELGFSFRIHGDEFTSCGGAEFGAYWKAASVDHLQFASDLGIEQMVQNNIVATILPGTSLYTAIPYTYGRRFLDKGCLVAIATDYNPGSCLIDNLPLVASLSGIHCGLKSHEIIAGSTFIPAISLGLDEKKGALTQGYDADVIIHKLSSVDEWIADLGQTHPRAVFINGKVVKNN